MAKDAKGHGSEKGRGGVKRPNRNDELRGMTEGERMDAAWAAKQKAKAKNHYAAQDRERRAMMRATGGDFASTMRKQTAKAPKAKTAAKKRK